MTSLRSTPQQLVEHALASSTADDCITIVRDVTSANLRWSSACCWPNAGWRW